MTTKQHVVRLSVAERGHLGQLITHTGTSAHTQRRARILLHADRRPGERSWTDVEIAAVVLVAPRTVARTRSDVATKGLEASLQRCPRRDQRPRKLEGEAEMRLVQLACSAPPPGHARWTLRLLSAQLGALAVVDAISPETVRTALQKTGGVPGPCSSGA